MRRDTERAPSKCWNALITDKIIVRKFVPNFIFDQLVVYQHKRTSSFVAKKLDDPCSKPFGNQPAASTCEIVSQSSLTVSACGQILASLFPWVGVVVEAGASTPAALFPEVICDVP
eukprot:3647598-Amphidinium_carterae.1